MIYSYTKCESVIAKIMADLDISEKNIRITDIREWIFEAIDKIGAPMQYIVKESGLDGEPILKIEDYLVPIPNGLQSLDAVAYSKSQKGAWVPMRPNTSAFKYNHKLEYCNKQKFIEDNEVPCLHEHEHDGFVDKPIKYKHNLYKINKTKYLESDVSACNCDEPMYFIKPGWIVTNQRSGYIKLAYKTIATDERGYPLIPDLASYQEAIYWYVIMKLNFPKYLKGLLGGKGVNNALNTYFYIQQLWNFYRNQAYAEAMMPTEGDLRNIKNDWTKLIPDWDSDDTFFKSQGERQLCYNDYYYGY